MEYTLDWINSTLDTLEGIIGKITGILSTQQQKVCKMKHTERKN